MKCVLIVEDDTVLSDMLHTLLMRDGYEVMVAGNGYDGLEKMAERRPDVIIADIMMPLMDGYAFYEAVQQRPEWVAIPFIFLTARDAHKDIMYGKALGAEDYITKPFSSDDLLVILRAKLKRANALHQAMELETSHLKENIVNVLSHELRTPLTFVTGYADLAISEAGQLPDDQFRHLLQGVKRGSDRLMRLIADLLLVFEIDADVVAAGFKTDLERCENLGQLVSTITAGFKREANRKGVTLNMAMTDHVPPVLLNKLYFPDALGRLISNGIKFTFDQGDTVTVNVTPTPKWVNITVQDNGVGVAPEDMQHLFTPFHQLHRDEMEQQGLGIGLYIAQQLIQLHGGTISVTSIPNQGSSFTIQLPRADAGN